MSRDITLVVLTALSLNPRPGLKALLERNPTHDEPKRKRTKPRVVVAQHRITPAETELLIERYEAGESEPDLAAAFGIHRVTVMRMLQRHGVERRVFERKLTDEQIAEAAELYTGGMRTGLIAARFGVDPQTVRNGFKRMGVSLQRRRAV